MSANIAKEVIAPLRVQKRGQSLASKHWETGVKEGLSNHERRGVNFPQNELD